MLVQDERRLDNAQIMLTKCMLAFTVGYKNLQTAGIPKLIVTMQGRQSLCDSFDKANPVVLSISRVHIPRPRLHVKFYTV